MLADKISGNQVGIWLLAPEHLRLGTWDLLCAWSQSSGQTIWPRMALHLVHEAAFCVNGLRPQRDSAEINAQKSEIGAQHLSPNPADSEARASINEKFQRHENKFASDPRMSDDRRERFNRTRAFLVNLIDLGYAPLTVDSWCDDLLDDRIDDGMPMDLVDTYWGQPVDTQEFVEYYVPYELCTYRTGDSDYHQVTYKNRVVSRPTSNVADVRTR